MAFHVIIFLIYAITLSSSTGEIDTSNLKEILDNRGSNSFTFTATYFYGDGVTLCDACTECSPSLAVVNLFTTNSEDYCVKCENDIRCIYEDIIVQVDFEFDLAWMMTYHIIKSSRYSDIHDPLEFSLHASNQTEDWETLSSVASGLYPQGRNESRTFPFENKKSFKFYRIVFKKKKADTDNVVRIGEYDISSFYTTQITNEVMFDLFHVKSSISPEISYGQGLKIGEFIEPQPEYSLTFSITPSSTTLDYLSDLILGTTLEDLSEVKENTYGQPFLRCSIEKNGYQLISRFSSTVNSNITFNTLPSMIPDQKNMIKIISVGHKIIITVNGVSQAIDSALSTRPPLPKLNFFWSRSDDSSLEARVVLQDLVFTPLNKKLTDPFMPVEQGICAEADGSTAGNEIRSDVGNVTSEEECLKLCIKFYHNVTAESRQDVSGCQYSPSKDEAYNCFVYDKAMYTVSKGHGDTGSCWPIRQILENAENGGCVKSDGSFDGYETRINLGNVQTIDECRGLCLEYYYRSTNTKRSYFSGCQFSAVTCFAYDDPNYKVTQGRPGASSNEQQCMPSTGKVFYSMHDGGCVDVNGSNGNENRLLLAKNNSITKEECLALCLEAFYESTENGNISGCQYDDMNDVQYCFLYHTQLFVANQGDGSTTSFCWTTALNSLPDLEISSDERTIPSSPPTVSILRNLASKINFFDTHDRVKRSLSIENSTQQNMWAILDKDEIDNATKNYYVDLPGFVTQDESDPFKCKCVHCEEDEVCGGLWVGNRYETSVDMDLNTKKIHIVVSHCKSPLDWIEDFVKGYEIASLHVITKCGEQFSNIKAPDMATIQILPNIGRCDHTYAYYIANMVPDIVEEDEADDSIVVFLKDDISANNLHQSGEWNNFEGLIRLASSENGFACGILPGDVQFGQHQFLLSAYHEIETLSDFSMREYHRNMKGYSVNESEFMSTYNTIGDWWSAVNAKAMTKLVQVCYGGVFAASVSNIFRQDNSVWKAIEKSLSRGNNIQEGHFAERSWGFLLSTPLQPFQIDALLYKSDGVYINKDSMHGSLLTRPQLYLEISNFGTHSTELLTEYLIQYRSMMKLDSYNIAVYGKFKNGASGFPNIDRLASCMWSDMIKVAFPDHAKEHTVCPEKLQPELKSYMTRSQKESHDLVISNPWLIHPGTAESLGIFVDPLWDVTTVIYYRRYFEWITIMFEYKRKEFLKGKTLHEMPMSAFRYIDFIRKHNKRLFRGKDKSIESVEILSEFTLKNIYNSKKKRHKVFVDQFDLTSSSDIKELTDLHEYTYFVAKEYNDVPKFTKVHVVNSHDIRGPEVNFFCHVLDYAENTCKAIIEEKALSDETLKTNEYKFIQKNTTVPFKLETALEDIAMAAYAAGRLQANNLHVAERSGETQRWIEMARSALIERKITAEDLPIECLDDFETLRLMQVSLAYEESLLPAFFVSSKGERNLIDTFLLWRFCSVNANEILQDSQWDFLFESAVDFTLALPKAFVHIGAPKTGSTSLQDTMTIDRRVLKDDKFFLAMHGQVRKSISDEYIDDNILFECDQLGACIWSDEERKIVLDGSGDQKAAFCPDYLPREFNKFLTKAKATNSSVVVSNEWLSQPSSETGLLRLFDGWQLEIILYYRRFYDWVVSAHYQWHFDINTKVLKILNGKVRFVDFLRMFCARLFASDSFSLNHTRDLEDLVDFPAYTYQAYKRYKNISYYENNIKIVNFHSGQLVETFYCDVLHAENACKLESGRSETMKTRSKTSTSYFDLAVLKYWSVKDENSPDTMEAIQIKANIIKERMTAMGFNEDDLPRECLTKDEQEKLLTISLAFEKMLLPDTYVLGGQKKIRDQFAQYSMKNRFCSIDLSIVDDPKWAFLFECIHLPKM